jgi:hypothetical protein
MLVSMPDTTLSMMSAKVAGELSQVVVELATHCPPSATGV